MASKPNFIVIGAAKCGTTSVCDLLGSHPDVFMTDPREPHYFSREEGFEDLANWYMDLFASAGDASAIGEGSTSYTKPAAVDRSAARIAATVPDCRLVYMLRHPIARLESDWKMRQQQGQWDYRCINEAVVEQPKLVWHGFYWHHLNVYRQYFRDDQIYVGFFEDFVLDPEEEMGRIFGHLGVGQSVSLTDPQRPRNRAQDRRADRLIMRILRRWPAFEMLKAALPRPMIEVVRSVATRRQPPPPVQWDPEVLEAVKSELRADARQLLEFVSKPPGFWDLD